jgi:16S rRNA (guanine966-N2)-methyltransferase
MRIIAGRLKGRRLSTPDWEGLRPTSDKLRETLFNIVAARMPGARVFDGCAGTGAVGLEALSRGAAQVVAAEHDRRAVALMRRNAVACGVAADYTIEHADVVAALRRLEAAAPFDMIFLDPPYAYPAVDALLTAAAARLAEGGVVILERATRVILPGVPSLTWLRDVRSVDSTLSFFVPKAGLVGPPEVS